MGKRKYEESGEPLRKRQFGKDIQFESMSSAQPSSTTVPSSTTAI